MNRTIDFAFLVDVVGREVVDCYVVELQYIKERSGCGVGDLFFGRRQRDNVVVGIAERVAEDVGLGVVERKVVEDDVAIEKEFADIDRCNETTDASKGVGLSIRHRIEDFYIDEIDGKVGECREKGEFGSVEIGLAGDETAYVVAHDGGEGLWRKDDVAHDDYGDCDDCDYA